jgi:hypothetical protein
MNKLTLILTLVNAATAAGCFIAGDYMLALAFSSLAAFAVNQL